MNLRAPRVDRRAPRVAWRPPPAPTLRAPESEREVIKERTFAGMERYRTPATYVTDPEFTVRADPSAPESVQRIVVTLAS